jgi:hypothetical protein
MCKLASLRRSLVETSDELTANFTGRLNTEFMKLDDL